MKLDRLGLNGYNLRETLIGVTNIPSDPPMQFYFAKLGPPGSEGDIIRILKAIGQGYYDEPLHVRGPLMSYLLMFSHRLFALKGEEDVYGACTSNLGAKVMRLKPPLIFKTQFWVVIVPFLFNLALIALVFFFGARFFGARAGFYAAVLLGLNPVSVMLAHRVLAEDVTVFFATASIFCYLYYFRRKNNLPGILLAGALFGLAILAKQTVIYGMVAVFFFTVLVFWKDRQSTKVLLRSCFRKEFILYGAAAAAVSFFWFAHVYKVYGDPFHTSVNPKFVSTDITGWFQAVRQRPHPIIFFSFCTVFLSPLFVCVFFSAGRFYQLVKSRPETDSERCLVFCWVWILVIFLELGRPWHLMGHVGNQEHRYFYIAYPAIAVLSGYTLDRLREWIGRWTRNRWAPDAAILGLLLLNAWVTIPTAMHVVYENVMLL
jgi:4-amino-4-deoxy-L-arabinose transferase-like glycosyltransferase